MFRFSKQKGFTLIELMVVVGIIVLLSTMMVVNYQKASKRARDSRRASDLEQIRSALEIYYADNDTYPGPGGMTEANLGKLSFSDTDGNAYIYNPVGSLASYHIYTVCTSGWEGSPIPTVNNICGGTDYGVTNP